MSGIPAIGVFELIIVSMFYSGVGIPLGIPPAEPDAVMLKMAPDACLFYTTWTARAAAAPDAPSHTEQLLAEPEVQDLLSELKEKFTLAMNEAAESATSDRDRLFAEWARDAVPLLLTHHVSLYLSDVKLTPDGPQDLDAGVIVHLGDRVAWAERVSQQLRETVLAGRTTAQSVDGATVYSLELDSPTTSLAWAIWNEYLIVGSGPAAVVQAIERAATPAPEWLVHLRQDLPVPRLASLAYFDAQRALELALQVAPPQARAAVQHLGLQHLRTLRSASGLDQHGHISRTLLSTDGTLPKVLEPLMERKLTAEQLRVIPADANFAAAAACDLPRIYDTFLEIASQLSPEAAQQIQLGASQLGQVIGANLRHDLLESIGNAWTIYSSPSEGGAFLTGLVAAIEVKDAKRLGEILGRVQRMIEGSLSEPRRLSSATFNGQTIYTLSGLGEGVFVSPSWCLTQQHLWVSVQPQNLRAVLSRGDDFQSLDGVPEVQRILQNESAPTSLRYVDSRDLIRAFYPMLPYVLEAIGNRSGAGRAWIEPAKLPSLTAILPHLRPEVGYLTRRAEGLEIVTHRTLPGSNLTASAPVVVALALPAVQAARFAARRASSINNMRQLVLGLINHEAAKGRFPAAALRTKDGKPGLSWRVAILPYVEEQELYEQFHLDEPWDSEHNRRLIAKMPDVFRSPTSAVADPGKTNYLAVRSSSSIVVDEAEGIHIRDITDGTSKTIALVEVDDERAVTWTKPDDLSWQADAPAAGLGGLYPGQQFLAAFADGHVEMVSKAIDPKTLIAAFTRNGGEVLPDGALQAAGR